jgi:hypothetical protein
MVDMEYNTRYLIHLMCHDGQPQGQLHRSCICECVIRVVASDKGEVHNYQVPHTHYSYKYKEEDRETSTTSHVTSVYHEDGRTRSCHSYTPE